LKVPGTSRKDKPGFMEGEDMDGKVVIVRDRVTGTYHLTLTDDDGIFLDRWQAKDVTVRVRQPLKSRSLEPHEQVFHL
jgi:hypothetical protein